MIWEVCQISISELTIRVDWKVLGITYEHHQQCKLILASCMSKYLQYQYSGWRAVVQTPSYCCFCVLIFKGGKIGDSGSESKTNSCWFPEHSGGLFSFIFIFGYESLKDDPCNDQPRCATAPDMIPKVQDFILEDYWLKLWAIAESIGISTE